MYGTDHPFFPPVGENDNTGKGEAAANEPWLSVTLNTEAVRDGTGGDEEAAEGILGGNAVRILGLDR